MANSKAAERRESRVVTKCDNPTEIAQNHEEMVTYVTQSSSKLKSKGEQENHLIFLGVNMKYIKYWDYTEVLESISFSKSK